MRSAASRVVAVAVLLAIAGSVGIIVYYSQTPASSTSPLTGQMHHDFGEVRKAGSIVRLEHDFLLKNVSPKTVTILEVKSSCGCTAAKPSITSVPPGESTLVSATLALQSARRRQETVWLSLKDHGLLPLTMTATVRRLHSLQPSQREMVVAKGGEARIVLIALDYETDITPDSPTITVPDGVSAQFEEWLPVLSVDKQSGRPARWQGIVTVYRTEAELPIGARLIINADSEESISIPLRAISAPGPTFLISHKP